MDSLKHQLQTLSVYRPKITAGEIAAAANPIVDQVVKGDLVAVSDANTNESA
jgi:hypothetical protein